MRRILIGFGLVLLLASPVQARQPAADLVLMHGIILTVDDQDSQAQAVAIRDGRIVAVGSDATIRPYIGHNTQVVDLAGHTATPGLIDSHAHILEGGLKELFYLELSHTASISDLLAGVRGQAARLAPGEWLQGAGWNEGALAEHRAPFLTELDAASAGHPLWLMNTTHHYSIANSAALALAGIDAATPDPIAGTIDRDASGKPTGILKEAAMQLVVSRLPPESPAHRRAALLHVMDEMHAEGMTGVKDPWLLPADWDAYAGLARDGGLSLHACVLFYAGADMVSAQNVVATVKHARLDAAAIAGHDLRVCGVKILLDGSAMARTAWMNDDYPADAAHPAPTGHGYPTVEPGTFRNMVRLFVAEDISIGTHVIGDQAIDLAADAYAEALEATPRHGLRLSLIHAHHPSDHALAVMAELEKRFDSGYPEIQAPFLWWLGDALPAAFGAARSQHVMPLATYRRDDIVFGGGSDYPVTPLAARYGLWASVARQPLNGIYGKQPFGTAEAVDIHTALRSYTIWNARQLFLEQETGSLEVGKWADIAIWDRNPYTVATADLKDMTCLMTFYKGKLVYRAH